MDEKGIRRIRGYNYLLRNRADSSIGKILKDYKNLRFMFTISKKKKIYTDGVLTDSIDARSENGTLVNVFRTMST